MGHDSAVLFVLDLDDTLYLETDYVKSGFNAAGDWLSSNRNLNGFAERAWQFFKQGNRGKIFDQALSELGIDDQLLIGQLVEVYRSHLPQISLMPDSKKFLKSKGVGKCALITDGFSNAQWSKIEALELDKYFSNIIVTGDWGEAFWKPHPRAFKAIQGKLDPSQCTYIADNPLKDFQAPRELGWATSIRIRRNGALHYNIETPPDCIEINSLEDILTLSEP